jgi:V/A-type H+-transporting ATPase subunit F
MKKIALITPVDAEFGFQLAGITQYAVQETDVERTLEQLMAGPDQGLIILDERLVPAVAEDRLREHERAWGGIVLVLPSPVKPRAGAEDYATRLIRRAIGYHVSIKV